VLVRLVGSSFVGRCDVGEFRDREVAEELQVCTTALHHLSAIHS